MMDHEVQTLKSAAEEAAARSQQQVWVSVNLLGKIVAEVEVRTASYRRMLAAASAVLEVVAQWRSSRVNAGEAMQAISAAVDSWQSGRS